MLLPNECTFKDSLLLKEFLNWRWWFCFYLSFPLQISEVSNTYVSDSEDIRLDCGHSVSLGTASSIFPPNGNFDNLSTVAKIMRCALHVFNVCCS